MGVHGCVLGSRGYAVKVDIPRCLSQREELVGYLIENDTECPEVLHPRGIHPVVPGHGAYCDTRTILLNA